ncbi:MAG: hypothetical protein GWN86_10180 [Desulfobacterales bacterium]|nr:hypothetical protein [Desulfobacterales bacterium]
MKRRLFVAGLLIVIVSGMTGLLVFTPNPLGKKIIEKAKARGYIAYTPDEAVELAYDRCTTCHGEEKVVKYCPRCGPPFIVTIHFMRKYVEIANVEGNKVEPFSDAELVAIAQVWNALVGNWEGDWPREDIKKLLENDGALIRLFETPVKERPIEKALQGRVAPGSYQRSDTPESKQEPYD